MFDTYVINLKDSTQRLSEISERLQHCGLKYKRIDAVDGRHSAPADFPEYNAKRSIDRHGRELTGGEVACYLSHVRALMEFISSDARQVLILEDDASFVADFGSQIAELSNALSNYKNWDVVNLVERRSDWKHPTFEIGNNLISRAFYFPMLTSANLWSKEGAVSFIQSKFGQFVSGPIDTELRSYCAVRGRGMSLENPISSPSGAQSEIDNSITTRTQANKAIQRRPIKPRIVRHFPDYANAWINMKFLSKLR
jgi:glycosyl transferase family 25